MVEDGIDWDGQFEYDVVADAQSMLAQLEAEADKNPRRQKREKGSPKSHGSGFLGQTWPKSKRYGRVIYPHLVSLPPKQLKDGFPLEKCDRVQMMMTMKRRKRI